MTTKARPAKAKPSRPATGATKGAGIKKTAVKPSADRGLSVRDLRERLGVSRKMFSRVVGFSERAIADWEANKSLSDAGRQRMHETARLQQALAGVMRPEYVAAWLDTPNDAFAGLKPIEVIERGEVDRIWRMIYQLESGIPT
jgi:DNA-binding transcriptional regulator YiaG